MTQPQTYAFPADGEISTKSICPGTDPNDCPVRIGKADALIYNCLNAADPDTYGNFRDSKYVQIKHHWFWKLSFAFQNLNIANNYENISVLLLEEDYYLMPDTLDVLNKLINKFGFFFQITLSDI